MTTPDKPLVTIISTERRATSTGKIRSYAICLCACGENFTALLEKINSGHTRSCGCLKRTHGMKHSRTYDIWRGMKHRCNNERATGYRYYGGRGIKLCERWNSSFQKFYEDMGVCPNGMSIERKDPNGNYCPENCIWATMKDQAKNKRNTIKYIVNGESITLSDLAKKSGIGYATLKYRIEKMQMSPDDAVRFKTKKK